MASKFRKVVSLPKEVAEDLEKALDFRYRNNLISRKDLKLTEGFRLVRRMPEWNFAMEKLKKLPKREDKKC